MTIRLTWHPDRNKPLRLGTATLVGAMLGATGCVVSHTNLTPDELPYYPPSGQDALDRLRSSAQMESVQAGEHALWMDIGKPLFAQRNSIEAFVLIGGDEIPMQEIDTARIIFEHELPLCGGSVDYSMRTRNQSVFGSRVYTRSSGPYTASVPMAGSWAWWSPINSRPTNDNFSMQLVGIEANSVIVRNYGDTTLSILSLTITSPGLRGFVISNAPSLPATVSCGESATFEVRWNEDPSVPSDLGTLQMQYVQGAPPVQNRVITLNAVPGPG